MKLQRDVPFSETVSFTFSVLGEKLLGISSLSPLQEDSMPDKSDTARHVMRCARELVQCACKSLICERKTFLRYLASRTLGAGYKIAFYH